MTTEKKLLHENEVLKKSLISILCAIPSMIEMQTELRHIIAGEGEYTLEDIRRHRDMTQSFMEVIATVRRSTGEAAL